MFPDKLTLFSHPTILILLVAMLAIFILEFIFRKSFFIIVNAAFAAFTIILGLYLELPLSEILILLLIALIMRLSLTLRREKHDV